MLKQTNSCVLKAVAAYIKWFQDQGIYDNTLFVIASDHGWTSHNPLLKGHNEVLVRSMFQNLMMVKPMHAQGGLTTSEEFITNAQDLGLKMHGYTFRADDLGDFDNFDALLSYGLDSLKFDGVFTDHPDKVVHFLKENNR